MRVRDWQDILGAVIETDAEPGNWQAVVGNRRGGLGEELYLGHPGAGVFLLKTFAKNPHQIEGVGTKVARKIDDDLEALFPGPDSGGRFGIKRPIRNRAEAEDRSEDLKAVLDAHRNAPTAPDDFFHDVMEALGSPAHGPATFEMAGRSESIDRLAGTFEEADELLSAELDELIDRSGVGRGFY